MQKLTLTAAKAVAETTKILLPLVYARDKTNIVHAYSMVTNARNMLRTARTEEEVDALTAEIKKMVAALPTSIAEAKVLSVNALDRLKKLGRPGKDGRTPIRLPPRRIRRAAARLIAKEERRLERERRENLKA